VSAVAAAKMGDAAVLKAKGLGMIFNAGEPNAVEAIADISFELNRGEVLAIVGPSGCGKTTVFNIIAGLLEPTRGTVEVGGHEVREATGHVGYMLQKDLLLPWRTVLDNVVLGLEIRGTRRADAVKIANALISSYGLKGFEASYPSQLSGGMRQRVAFMRTLAFDPDVVLLDEPFSALDSQTRLILQADILRIINERNFSVVLVTHDVAEAITMADRIIVITARPGHVKCVYNVPFGREERHPLSLRTKTAFNELFQKIWGDLGITIP